MTLDLTKEEPLLTDIYEFTLANGFNSKLYLTPYGGAHRQLPHVDGKVYKTVPITRGPVSAHTNLQTDSCNVRLGIHAFTIKGLTLRAAIQLGWFEDAQVIISAVNPDQVTEKREIFRGKVTKAIKYNRKEVTLPVVSLEFLKETVPRVMYQEPCNHQPFDKYCALNKSTYEVTGSAGAGSDKTKIYSAVFDYATHVSPYYVLGEIQMTSGENNGVSRTIRLHNDGNVEPYDSFDLDLAVGDTFKVYPGCDLSGQTCDEKFNNYLNFGGMEYIPRPEVMY